MRRTRRGVTISPRPEALESKLLLSGNVGQDRPPALRFDPAEFANDRILVRYRPDLDANAVTPALAGTSNGPAIGLVPGLRVVSLAPGIAVADALASYRADARVLYAEPDAVVRIDTTPNDPKYTDGTLWGLNNTGQSNGKADADIDAPEAWGVTTGSASTIVAVIDTGVDYNHPDLAANIWTNTAEATGRPGVDDDGDGYIDDVHGYDFINNDPDPLDDNSHGTHVSGTIGAIGNNGTGVVGVNWNVKIMALKFLGSNGSGYLSDGIRALDYAVAKGASISNNSYGGGGYDQAFADAIENARLSGHIFVAAAGNDSNNSESNPAYPASYPSANVISVAATDRNDNLASFSNYGATTVDLAAPGVSIYSTVPNGGYGTKSGTSMATPHVVGVAALVRGLHPNWTSTQVIDAILGGVDPIASVAGKVATGGRLNAKNAVDAGSNTNPPPVTGVVADYDFEADAGSGGSLEGWTTTGLWHLSNARGTDAGHSGTHELYYGQNESTGGGGNYDTGVANSGTATSPTIDLTGFDSASLAFNYRLKLGDARVGFDRVEVQIGRAGTWTTIASRDDGQLQRSSHFTSLELDLTPFVGGPIQVRLAFNSVDAKANTAEGCYFDDISVNGVVVDDDGTNQNPPPPTVPVTYDFEADAGNGGSLEGWTTTGLWHLSNARGTDAGHSGTHELYYGQNESTGGGGNYDTGVANSGTATSPTIDLTGFDSASLAFNYRLKLGDARVGFDRVEVQIGRAGTWTTIASRDDGQLQRSSRFAGLNYDLTSFVGGPIQVRLAFNSVDAKANTAEGCYFDDISIDGVATGGSRASSLASGGAASGPDQVGVDGYLKVRDGLILGYYQPDELSGGLLPPPPRGLGIDTKPLLV